MAPDEIDRLGERLARWCAVRLRADGIALDAPPRVSHLQRIFGGASRETWRFRLTYRPTRFSTASGSAGEQTDRLILRRDPGASLIDTERRVEFAAYQRFAGSAVPVPQVLWLEEDPQALDHPFFVMREVTGCDAGPARLMAEPYRSVHAQIATHKWSILGEIARADPGALAITLAVPTPHEAWLQELNHWAAIVDREALEPQPIAQAAIRWLRSHPPLPAQRISIVHGDFRTGNLLVSPQGRIEAVLDWEMMHLGDPLEDLAWGLNRVWQFQPGLAGGLATREQAIAHWRAASGCAADPRSLHWWELSSCIKGQAIWLTAGRALETGANRDLMMGLAAWMMINSQDRVMLELMGRLSASGLSSAVDRP